jgi:hypothetical protein
MIIIIIITIIIITSTPLWLSPAYELYRPSDRHLSANLVPTSVDRGCSVVRAVDPLRP